MAVFTAIPDTDLDANSPITENLMLALRDNAVAIAEGDATAPNISNNAFADNSINGAKLLSNTIYFTKLKLNLSGGDSSQSLTLGQSYVIPKGVYMFAITSSYLILQVYVSGAWRNASSLGGCIVSDGANVRVTVPAFSGPYTIYLKKVL